MIFRNVAKTGDDPLSDLQGVLTSLAFSYPARILRVNHDTDGSHPTHTIYLRPQGREYVAVGSGWQKTVTRGANAGAAMLSCTINDPSFGQINFALFDDGDGNWSVRWSRPRGDKE